MTSTILHSISTWAQNRHRHLSLSVAVFAVSLLNATPTFAKPQCLSMTPSQCLLSVEQTGFRAQIDERGRIVLLFGKTTAEIQAGESYVVVQDDLARLEADEEYSSNETTQVKNELADFDGAVYNLPAVDDLKLALGFPAGSNVGPQDYFDLVHVHMQLVLSISALTAGYLSDLMGLNLASQSSPTPAPSSESQDTVAPTPNQN